ncbi:hemerythrin domain-containing protein [Methylonatrum kenyense]|uniref:hemerythrin domain-containing protein n=1 Tax=Methylonatrum kenyense TaxID=455253 RepID=UPI0020C0D208|nr:hemerythrin domain-containing protein [Methylonatrum kenyense]MCK8515872.1 hemerythrin domain-containing protein [Methylonatrum kenyense]
MQHHQESSVLRHCTLHRISATMPGATSILRDFGLDIWRDSNLTLAQAAENNRADVEALETRLSGLLPFRTRDIPEHPGKLIQHIITHYHDVHRYELPRLIQLAERVEQTHRHHPQCPQGLSIALETLGVDLDTHMRQEEQVLFRMMQQQPPRSLAAAIACMREDHDEHNELLQKLETLTDGLRLPEDACGSWNLLYRGLAKFLDDLIVHTHLEEAILFPHFEGAPTH